MEALWAVSQPRLAAGRPPFLWPGQLGLAPQLFLMIFRVGMEVGFLGRGPLVGENLVAGFTSGLEGKLGYLGRVPPGPKCHSRGSWKWPSKVPSCPGPGSMA